MAFLIHVFNSIPIERLDPQQILAAITESNYHTLCNQYGLDPALIGETRSNLKVLAAPGAPDSFFTVTYHQGGGRPIVVHFQGRGGGWGGEVATLRPAAPARVRAALADATQLVSVELNEAQLRDLGLLLGYELARWAAVQGQGIMRGLDGRWYRLNAYKAFLPIEVKS